MTNTMFFFYIFMENFFNTILQIHIYYKIVVGVVAWKKFQISYIENYYYYYSQSKETVFLLYSVLC